MRRTMTERGRRVLVMLLVGSLLAMFAGALPVVADYDANPERVLPETVTPGQEFRVTVTFVAPAAGFEIIGLEDAVPEGWLVTVNPEWCTPYPSTYNPVEPWQPGPADYSWYGPHGEGTEFTAEYDVKVPDDAEDGTYTFSGTLSYTVAGVPGLQHVVGGDQTVTIGDPNGNGDSGEVELIARTPAATGCIKLVKEFVAPDGTELPSEVLVRVTGDDFNETYTITAGADWEKVICGIPTGIYTVHELSLPGWIPSYDPPDRDLTVTEGTVPGAGATMTITNTYSWIGISVSPAVINFGEITPGETKGGDTITVTNTGSVAADVRAEVDADTTYNDGGDHFYTDALRLAGEAASGGTGDDLGSWTADELGLEGIAPAGGSADVPTAVVCPAEMYPDTEYTGKLLFIASASD